MEESLAPRCGHANLSGRYPVPVRVSSAQVCLRVAAEYPKGRAWVGVVSSSEGCGLVRPLDAGGTCVPGTLTSPAYMRGGLETLFRVYLCVFV